MAAATGGLNILPQYQGDYYSLQRQQALADALMGNALKTQTPQMVGSGQYQVMPKYSLGQGVSQLGQALLGGYEANQASQGLNQLGQNQMNWLTGMMGGGAGQSPQPDPGAGQSGVGGSVSGDSNAGGSGQYPDASALGAAVANYGAGTPGVSGSGNPGAVPPGSGPNGVQPGVGQGGAWNPLGMNPSLAAMMYFQDPQGFFKAQAGAYTPTAATMAARQGNMDPVAANRAQFAHDTYLAPVTGTPGTTQYDALTGQPIRYNPNIPAGGQPAYDAKGNFLGVMPTPGYNSTVAGTAGAVANAEGAARSNYGLTQVYDQSTGQMRYVPNSQVLGAAGGAQTPDQRAIVQTESGGNPNAVSPKGAMGAWQVMPNTNSNPGFGVRPAQNNSPAEMNRVGQDYYTAMVSRYGNPTLGAIAYNMGPGNTDAWLKSGGQWEKLPQETRNYVGKVSTLTAINSMPGQQGGAGVQQGSDGPMAAGPTLGATANANAAATAQQDELSKDWTNVNATNQSAQSAISLLQGIKQQAASGAIVGPNSDKVSYLNNILTTLGFSEKATDRTTATQLLDKYGNQIVSRLGAGGMETDAARTILAAANPNSHMTQAAINEASDYLIGGLQMAQAKAGLLQGAANARNTTQYNNLRTTFDQNADPRIWQWMNIQNPVQKQQFARSVLAQDPKFAQKIQNLENLGVFK